MRKNKVNGKDGLIIKNSRRLAWKRIVFVLGCVVVFCTTYALILPAITMEVTTYCGFEEHIHTDECYKQITSESIITPVPAESSPILHHHNEACFDELGVLICGEADYVVHTHDENCYDEDGNLWCPLPEISMHIHDESCNIPQDVENEFHIHTDECYEISEKLICGFDTTETDISGSEIIGGITGELTTSTDESIFPAPPVDEFASGEVTTVAEPESTVNDLPELITEPISMPVAQPIISEPISEAVTTAQTDDSGFGEIIPGIGSPVDGTVTAAPVHQHTDECYVYEKTLICAKAESVEAPELGENALGLMSIDSESYGFMENPEEPTATIELDEPNDSDESFCTDLLETYDAFGNLIEPSNQDETAEPSDSLNAAVCTLPEVILHEHDFNCYNESGELVCGMLVVRAHQHTQECNGICYIAEEIAIDETALTCEIPECEGAHLHSLEYGCFDENMNIICPLEESLGHIHDIHCFGKWELICGMEEHDHTEECEIDPDDVTLDNEIMMLANAAGTWGYNPDGSIYWNRTYDLATVPLSDIKVNTPYIFCGQKSTTLMTYNDFIMVDPGFESQTIQHTYRKTVFVASVSDFSAYQYWYFEEGDGANQYYIYYQDNIGNKRYLTFSELDKYVPWNEYTANIVFADEKSSATQFTVTSGKENNNALNISGVIEGQTIYINPYFGDGEKTTCWWGHKASADIKACTPTLAVSEDTAQRLPTVTSSNTIINLFDYWIASDGPEGQFMPDNGNDYPNSGINNGHPFHFVWKGDDTIRVGGTSVNRWVGENNYPLANIVAKTLGNDGYPHLSTETGSSDSLAYLFDPQIQHAGKASYRRVGGLLRNDEQGYYFFDSKQTMAEYNSDKNEIYIYNTPGIKERETDANTTGHFFPFNQAPEVMEAARDNQLINHYFGMTITTRFLQKNGGYTSLNQQIPTSFHFSGDDDVWIFIDDVLVGDCGGIHDACSVDIDFSTGVVNVYNNARPDNGITTTIRDAFEAAGKTYDNPEKSWNGNTFADDTTHTLKFFYLERGNYSSNLELKYNLIDIPETSIYKVNQYGEVVPGAKFAVYAADANYNMLNNKDGIPVIEPATPQYNTYGDMVDDNNNVIAKALYTGITDSFGEMIFEDRNEHTPLTIGELRGMFGDCFILREIEVPDGYRVVSKDAWLRIWENGSQSILSCVNTSKTGSRAASTLQVTATDTIWVNELGNATQKTYFETETVNGHTITKPTGLMFAVVLKYTGPTYENGDPIPGALGINTNWTPIYGDDKHGYSLANVVDGNIVGAAIESAKQMDAKGTDVIFSVSPSCNMQLTLENLPGDITSYYRMLDEEHRNQTRYTVGFYWTNQPSLSTATSDNTFAVYSHKDDFERAKIENATEFTRTFGANIQIPNLINRIFVQKIDENNNLINGATFAIYEVEETNGDIFFKNSVSINSEYNVDSTSGKITADSGAILATPIATTTTATLPDNIHVGTGEFVNLNDGKYIIKEIKSPSGYALNKTNIMVLVTEDTIYANAGTEDDGVVVGRGPGYVVNTLNHFASKDDIDSTLTWIYAKMKISNPSTSFNDVGDESKIKGYISKNMSSETVENADSDGVFKTYMMYTPSDASAGTHVAFNYYPNVDKYKALGVDTVTQYRRIFTTSGWPYYELWQDYEWGIEHKTKGANYEQWPNELTNLFSRSTYIRVKDDEDSTLTVYKVNSDGNAPLSGAKFRLYRTNSAGANEYYSRDESTDVVNWVAEESAATVITTGENGNPAEGFTHLKNGTYYLEETVAPAGFIPISHPITVTINLNNADKMIEATVPNGDNTINRPLDSADLKTEFNESSNVYTFTVTVRNTVGHELPQTGGCGTQAYTVVGISIILLAIALTIIKRRRTA